MSFCIIEFPKTLPFPASPWVSVVSGANLQLSSAVLLVTSFSRIRILNFRDREVSLGYPVSLLIRSSTPLLTLLGISLGSLGMQMASADHSKGTPSVAGYQQPQKHPERDLPSPGSAQWEVLQSL